MKRINVKTKVLDVFGKPIKDQTGAEETVQIALVALLRNVNLDKSKENRIYVVMSKIASAKDVVELEEDEFNLLQEAVTCNTAKIYTTGQEIPILNRDERGFLKHYLDSVKGSDVDEKGR
jgi:hypothetical protein